MQILGERARARVPADFITQSLYAANPPTLFLVLADMARGLRGADKHTAAADLQFLQAGELLHPPGTLEPLSAAGGLAGCKAEATGTRWISVLSEVLLWLESHRLQVALQLA